MNRATSRTWSPGSLRCLDVCLPGRYELIVVDDDSPDQTWAVGLRPPTRYPALRVMRRRSEKGLSTAVIRDGRCAG